MKGVEKYLLSSDMPVAVFDSGLGGLSTLKELVKRLPHEDFIYFGDFNNAPYGSKDAETVKKLTFACVEKLLLHKVKAIVIACNTATSAAAKELRQVYDFLPIIGAEPALKPAVINKKNSNILVLATEMTLSEVKFKNLCAKFSQDANIIPLACPGLVEFVERGEISGNDLRSFLFKLIKENVRISPDAVVLGCTHYPFVAKAVSEIIGDEIPLFDGNIGIANECARRLNEIGMISLNEKPGNVIFSGNGISDDKLKIAKRLMEM